MDVRVPDPAPSKIRWRSSAGFRLRRRAWRGRVRSSLRRRGQAHPTPSRSDRSPVRRGDSGAGQVPVWRFEKGDACSPHSRVIPPVTSGASASPRSVHATTHRKTQNCHRRRGVRARRRSAGPLPQAAAANPAAPTATAADGDPCQSQCADILPPGRNGNATLAEILAHRVLGTRPAHSSDQLGRYDSLVGGYGGLTDARRRSAGRSGRRISRSSNSRPTGDHGRGQVTPSAGRTGVER